MTRLRTLSALLALALLFATAAPARAQDDVPPPTPEEVEEMAVRFIAGFVFRWSVDPYEETSMTTGEPLDTGLAQLREYAHGVINKPPAEAFEILAQVPGMTTLAPGDAGFGAAYQQAHYYLLHFGSSMLAGDIAAEFGVSFEEGGVGLADRLFPAAPTSGQDRGTAVTVAGDMPTAVYTVTKDDGSGVDVFASPYFVGRIAIPDGSEIYLFVGPFGPEWWPYVSGAADADPTDPGLIDRLAGWRDETRPQAFDEVSLDEARRRITADPELALILEAALGGADPSAEVPVAPPVIEEPASDVEDEPALDVVEGSDDPTDETAVPVGDATTDGAAIETPATGGDEGGDSNTAIIVVVLLLFAAVVGFLARNKLLALARSLVGRPAPVPEDVVAAPERRPDEIVVTRRPVAKTTKTAKKSTGVDSGPRGGRTIPGPPPVLDGIEVPPPDPATSMAGGGWVELARSAVRAQIYRRVAEIAEEEGLGPNENGNVVPTEEMWERAFDEVAVDGLPEHESLRAEVDTSFDPEAPRPAGVPGGSSIEVDGSTGRAFWRPPGGGSTEGPGDVVPL
jgi:hypothetical protein